eukprot:gene7323-14933_t
MKRVMIAHCMTLQAFVKGTMGDSIEEARARMIAKRFGGNDKGASTGGGGSTRRKKKSAHHTPNADDKKLGGVLKKLGCTAIPGIEEVNIFKDDDVIQFTNPKVQASIQSNTYAISGASETKPLAELLPSLINQLGPDNMAQLSKLMKENKSKSAAAAAPQPEEEDDEIPDLVDNFEEMPWQWHKLLDSINGHFGSTIIKLILWARFTSPYKVPGNYSRLSVTFLKRIN